MAIHMTAHRMMPTSAGRMNGLIAPSFLRLVFLSKKMRYTSEAIRHTAETA